MRRLISGVVAVGLLALSGCVAPSRQDPGRPGGAPPSVSPWGGPSIPAPSIPAPSISAPASPGPRWGTGSSDVAAFLRDRADAVLTGDRGAFLAPVREAGFRAEQARLFDNLRRLPVADLFFGIDGGGGVYRDLRLAGVDSAPTRTPAGFQVVPTAQGPVVERAAAATEPWDLASVRVRRAPGVIVVHDRASAGRAAAVAASVARGRGPVSRVMGRSFEGLSVVYLFRAPAVVAAYRGPNSAPGVVAAIAQRAFGARGEQVGTRIALLPSGADLPPLDRARLLRHELVHVLLPEGHHAPLWLVEGLADYVGHRVVPRRQQRLEFAAIDRARRGLTRLPTAQDFAGVDGLAAYDISWMAAEQIAADVGSDALVGLAKLLSAPRFNEAEPVVDGALRDVVGYDERELARRTAMRILSRFGG